ncbi:MAG TPA: cytochrome c oxidase subunit II [Acidimicrobiales bacterium]|nr:cytochrome c oxidase subunit II [Acidimicrobiales bacterium]
MNRLRRLAPAAAALTLFLGACSRENQPQNVLDPEAPIARQLDDLWDPVFGIAVVIFILVQALVLIVAIRFRRRGDDDNPKQIHGNNVLEFGWTITPALILAFVGFFTVLNIGKLDAVPKGPDVLRVEVVGHQWWWEFAYPKQGFVTANEMHIPVGSRIDVRITSADVIHSFWPPKLAGKLDAIPGRVNHLEIKTEGVEPGTYWGQCAEYCGLSHANMRLKVVVHSQAGYGRWEAGQMRSPSLDDLAAESAEASGRDLFRTKGCGGCHAIDGYAAGKIGPNLSHFMSRKTFAGAIFPNNVEELRAWLRNPPRQKPMMPNNGMGMPNLNLAENEISDLIAFLETLR